ncbi:trans-aconitate 2-methyltransferase [Rhipicephalus sanguineus]|uniref:trans-aconitate 2-methyltransferase n=1 Tax=Rhipicephalus sanguineus TaxID=34632 RepID=UPI0020C3B769|nr:trans-aconitate 2-methyltransferase [Rhipicephalus sanguineus]
MAFRTPCNESQQFLDIGCGPGNFTLNSILPSCEPCKRIVAVDSLISMIEYAQENCAHEKIVYDYLDIDNDVSAFSKKYGAFQRVYSFKTLHWSKDLHRSLDNIAKLMTPGAIYQIANPLYSLLNDEERPAFVDTLSRHLNEWQDSYLERSGQNVFSAFLVHAVKPEE